MAAAVSFLTSLVLLSKRARLLRAIGQLDETKPGPGFTCCRSPGNDRWTVLSVNRENLRDKIGVGDTVVHVQGEQVSDRRSISQLLRGKPFSVVHVRLRRREPSAQSFTHWTEIDVDAAADADAVGGAGARAASARDSKAVNASGSDRGCHRGDGDGDGEDTCDIYTVSVVRVPRSALKGGTECRGQ